MSPLRIAPRFCWSGPGKRASCRSRLYSPCENHHPADCLQHIHDLRLVRTPQVPKLTVVDRDPRELADRICRVLLSSSRQPDRLVSIFDRAAKNDSGSDHARGVFSLFRDLFARAGPMELRRCFWADRWRCVFYVSRGVDGGVHSHRIRAGD